MAKLLQIDFRLEDHLAKRWQRHSLNHRRRHPNNQHE